ncbi:uncharacterized protein [Macrobrachium rosenbergii]|uniref:uncharacterized protein n=1 Tax=Macrobrachium rosenbergii TaxID=79674 RepID=UPI0034D794B9
MLETAEYPLTLHDGEIPPGIRPPAPHPKVDHNIVFVRLPEELGGEEPIVVPPPQQKNIVYVLKKESDRDGSGVIHVPAPPKSSPEVYFVNVGEGENPLLPTGEDLHSALSKSGVELNAQVVGGGGGGGGDSFGHEISTNYGPPEIITNYGPPEIITNYGPPEITTTYRPPEIITNYGPPTNPPSVLYSSP